MKIKLNEKDSNILKKDKTYTLVDNTKLSNLVVSKTILHPKKNTNGHNHVGKEEVYHFVSGQGYIRVGDKDYSVSAGSIVLIPDGWFHKVWNPSEIEDLVFVCVFEGKRNH